MKEIKVLDRDKNDYKELEAYLLKHDLLDDHLNWLAGFPDSTRGTENAVARNLLYGNKRLMVVCIKEEEVYVLHNSKEGFKVSLMGTLDDKYYIESRRNFVHPAIDVANKDKNLFSIQVTKNKSMVKIFKKLIK